MVFFGKACCRKAAYFCSGVLSIFKPEFMASPVPFSSSWTPFVAFLLAEITYWEIEHVHFVMRLLIEVLLWFCFSHFPQAAEYNAGLCIDWLTCMAPKNRMVCFFSILSIVLVVVAATDVVSVVMFLLSIFSYT